MKFFSNLSPLHVNRLHKNLQPVLWFCTFLLIISLLTATFTQTTASADGETTLTVTPSASQVLLNNSTTVTLYASNTVDLNAFDVTVTYDPTIVTLTSWSYGNLLSNLMEVVTVDNPGLLRVVATQTASPGVTGNGILLNMVFTAIAYGTTPITITNTRFSNKVPVSSYPIRVNGSLQVYGDPTAVELLSFAAISGDKDITLSWETATEIDNLGFNLYRSSTPTGERVRLNSTLIPCGVYPGAPFGARYSFTDSSVKKNRLYYYWLEDLDIYGKTNQTGPIEAQLQKSNAKGQK